MTDFSTLSTEMVRIGLIDDRPLYREGLKEILVAIDEFAVVGQADDVDQAVDVLDEKIDVILLHVRMPDRVTPAAVRRLRASFPDSQIIVLTMDSCPELIGNLSNLGVNGYLTNITRRGLVSAIRCILENYNHVLLSLSRDTLTQLPALFSPAPPPLTPRELEILALTSQALSNTQIARQTFLTEATVKRHLRNIFIKLGAVSRIDAVNKAVAAALLPPAGGMATSD